MAEVVPLRSLDLRLDSKPWGFAQSEHAAIMAHWKRTLADHPYLWNGDVLICTEARVTDGVLAARFATADFASFLAWRDWDWPDRSAYNCFGLPAVVSRDGALLMGVMGPRTLNRGKIYPPSGSLEPRDVMADGRIDIEGSMRLELMEETGLDLEGAIPGELFAVIEGQRLAVVRRFDLPIGFAEIESIFARHNTAESDPELSAILGYRSPDDMDPGLPGYTSAIVRHIFRARGG